MFFPAPPLDFIGEPRFMRNLCLLFFFQYINHFRTQLLEQLRVVRTVAWYGNGGVAQIHILDRRIVGARCVALWPD